MRIKDVRKDNMTVQFKDLEFGDEFMIHGYNNFVYVKIPTVVALTTPDHVKWNSIRFPSGQLNTFKDEKEVIPVEVEMHVLRNK